MPLSIQVKLLRVLQDGTFSRVGSNDTLKTDVRIVAATHKNLSTEVTTGRFREDLYYRLNVVELRIPPLRERPEDIPLLAEYFLQKITRKNGMARIRFSSEATASYPITTGREMCVNWKILLRGHALWLRPRFCCRRIFHWHPCREGIQSYPVG